MTLYQIYQKPIRSLAASMAFSLAIAGVALAAQPLTPAVGQWSAQRANEWYARQPWLFGFNFVPSTAVNDTEMWQKETFDPATIDRELAWAQGLGYNSCRVFVQYIVWKADPAGFKKRFTRLLEIADKHQLRVMPVLFDDCAFGDPPQREPYLGKQREPIPGMILPSWTPSPGLKLVTDKAAWPDLEKYVRDMVGTFKNDKRIVLWDLYNEPGNSGMGNNSLPLVEASFAWARQMKPTQPLTISVWGGPKEISDRQLELSDIVSFHHYGDNNSMAARIKEFKIPQRPVICTEWMARTMGAKYQTELPLFKDAQVGCYNWGLVNGRTQCQYPWGSPKDAPEPPVWFHDLLRRDGSPKNPDEVAFIRKFTNAPGVNRLKPIIDEPMRDTCVCVGPDAYYLIGTTGHPNWWKTNEGIKIWKSKDLVTWEPMGLVWSFAKDMTWQKKQGDMQAIWAPEMHYINGTFWIPYCVNYCGTGILKSTSGKPEGPYVDIKKDGPLTGEIDASLFQDDDGKVYFVYNNGKIARLKEDMTGLAEEPKQLVTANNGWLVGFEGGFIFKENGRYHLSCADFTEGRYHCYVASSKNLMGPYGPRYLAIPHGGHNTFFKDKKGNWWSTFFGNDGDAIFNERAGILRVEFGLDGEPRPMPIR